MSMSRDRVHFLMKDNDCNHGACIVAAAEAFGLPRDKVEHMLCQASIGRTTTIVCRPSQFARFLIRRSECTRNNAYKQFEAVLHEVEDAKHIDVSGVPRNGYYRVK